MLQSSDHKWILSILKARSESCTLTHLEKEDNLFKRFTGQRSPRIWMWFKIEIILNSHVAWDFWFFPKQEEKYLNLWTVDI